MLTLASANANSEYGQYFTGTQWETRGAEDGRRKAGAETVGSGHG